MAAISLAELPTAITEQIEQRLTRLNTSSHTVNSSKPSTAFKQGSTSVPPRLLAGSTFSQLLQIVSDPFDSPSSLLAAHEANVLAHYQDELKFFRGLKDTGPEISEQGLGDIVFNGSVATIESDGWQRGVVLEKDIPKLEHGGFSTFWGVDAGCSAYSRRALQAAAKGLDKDALDPRNSSSSQISLWFQPFFDIWIILVHKRIWIVVIFWLRVALSIADAQVIVVTSSKVRHPCLLSHSHSCLQDLMKLWPLVVSGAMYKALRTDSPELLRRFFIDFDSTVLEDLLAPDLEKVVWHDLPLVNFIAEHVGTIQVVQLANLPNSFRIVLCQLDAGIDKYDPILRSALRNVITIVEMKAEMLRRFIARVRPASERQALHLVKTLVETAWESRGLRQVEQDFLEQAVNLQRSLMALRTYSAEARDVTRLAREAIKTGQEGSLEEVKQLVKDQRRQERGDHASKAFQGCVHYLPFKRQGVGGCHSAMKTFSSSDALLPAASTRGAYTRKEPRTAQNEWLR